MLTDRQPVERLMSKQIQNLISELQNRCKRFEAVTAAYIYGSVLREDFVVDRETASLGPL
jgi:hypothetical protein